MNILQALLLGILQGVTEFAPVSSSGHLVLVPWLLRWPQPDLVFDTTLHLGTLAAVLVFFARDIVALLRAWWESVRERRLTTPESRIAWALIIGTIPAGVLGFLLEGFFASLFEVPFWVSIFLLITGVILAASERLSAQQRSLETVTRADALAIGLAQAAAIAPGISRSGATIGAGLALGLARRQAARFSFLLSLPIILAAGAFKLLALVQEGIGGGTAPLLLVGFVAAAVSGYLCIRFLLSFLQRGRLYVFALYCWTLGILSLLILAFRAG